MGDKVIPVEKPGYFAVIPANVRYDTTLRPAAKLLYAEISALCNKYGYCTARNTYFSALYDTSKKSVEGWMKQLKDAGYIRLEVIRDKSNAVISRKIWITESALAVISQQILITESSVTPPLKNQDTSPKNLGETPLKNYSNNNNTSINNIPPISPTGEKPERKKAEPAEPSKVFEEYAGQDDDLLNTLLAFAADRETRKKGMTDNARRLLCRKLDRLADDNAGKIELLEHAIVMGWDSVYSPRDKQQQKPVARPAAPRKETREL